MINPKNYESQIEIFQIHNRISTCLQTAVDEMYFTTIYPAKGRNVGEQFAPIHNVWLMWLKEAAPDLLKGLIKMK